ncbi:hypothetical protein QTO34_002332 [Cnephaeus nilssonii]|uniref:WAP domain-containing protein n=1 Tax=Cnephaeus nilssonii TaxID=3371016 RepID=A0AA40HUP3_CNENI|nr:hypothetical protein QTO34_002332 [Eptesicus nilssonii]
MHTHDLKVTGKQKSRGDKDQGLPRAHTSFSQTLSTGTKPPPPKEIQICEKRFKIYLCRRTCTQDRDCQANNICCLSFCGEFA